MSSGAAHRRSEIGSKLQIRMRILCPRGAAFCGSTHLLHLDSEHLGGNDWRLLARLLACSHELLRGGGRGRRGWIAVRSGGIFTRRTHILDSLLLAFLILTLSLPFRFTVSASTTGIARLARSDCLMPSRVSMPPPTAPKNSRSSTSDEAACRFSTFAGVASGSGSSSGLSCCCLRHSSSEMSLGLAQRRLRPVAARATDKLEQGAAQQASTKSRSCRCIISVGGRVGVCRKGCARTSVVESKVRLYLTG